MDENNGKIEQLSEKLSSLMKKQESFQKEIDDLRWEIQSFRTVPIKPEPENPLKDQPVNRPVQVEIPKKPLQPKPVNIFREQEKPDENLRLNLEKFIGENLINKIGIIITVIGVGIGTKYAIDHQLINPLTRILLGYLFGLGLLGFAFYLKKQYENFSAVLLSGSMAIFYFITFFAYSFYALIPSIVAFAMMVVFTLFTVAAAIGYNRQVIAHFGLVGAYAVPFLLSDGTGRVVILFSYMAIVNAGILILAFRKYWKPLYYSSFIFTWLIFITWFMVKYEGNIHFALSWIFLSIFFITFYFIFLAYKLLKKEKFGIEDILLLFANSSVFYGLGVAFLDGQKGGDAYQGLFTLGNGLIHFVTSIIIYRQKESDKNLFYFTVGLVIAFITIAIPVQLHGNWITVLWSVEAALLFAIGRSKNQPVYEILSYPLMGLAFFSIAHGWHVAYSALGSGENPAHVIPLFNVTFLTSLIFILSFGFINIMNNKKQFTTPLIQQKGLTQVVNFIMPGMLLIVFYFAFYLEIKTFWNQLYFDTMVSVKNKEYGVLTYFNYNINSYKTISLLIYSFLFFTILSFINIMKLKKRMLGLINMGFNLAVTVLFLIFGLFALGSLRETYINSHLCEHFYNGSLNIGLRYFSFLFLALLIFSMHKYLHAKFLEIELLMEFEIFLHVTILTILGNELINWMDLFNSGHSYKLGLSILFGAYSLLLIAIGILKKKRHLRIGAIVLFSCTLLKLFFYDLTSLDTISKTIVFVVLGVLLLIISFLYNKYRKAIFEDLSEE